MSELQKYSFGTFDFGGGSDDNFTVKGPKGKKGLLRDYGVEAITETFSGTTSATVAVGTSANPDAYGEEITLDDDAADTVGSISARTLATDPDNLRSTYIVEPDLPADTVVYMKCSAGVGGSPTGQAQPFMIIEWQD